MIADMAVGIFLLAGIWPESAWCAARRSSIG